MPADERTSPALAWMSTTCVLPVLELAVTCERSRILDAAAIVRAGATAAELRSLCRLVAAVCRVVVTLAALRARSLDAMLTVTTPPGAAFAAVRSRAARDAAVTLRVVLTASALRNRA